MIDNLGEVYVCIVRVKRREFFNWAGIGLLASYFPIALAACSTEQKSDHTSGKETTTKANANLPDGDGYIAIGPAQKLNNEGYLIHNKSNLIVFRNSDNSLSTVSLLCTHQGCKVDWQKSSSILYCPCHGSEFTAEGKVVKGPAQSPLSNIEVKEERKSILVKVV